MSISVHHAVALPKDSPVASHALPEGFPLLVINEQAKIIESVLLYQLSNRLKLGTRYWQARRNTSMAEAFDLRDWFDYLAHVKWKNPISEKTEMGKPWDLATESDYIAWRDTMQELISPQTNRKLANNTIARRQGTVERFYVFAQKQGWYTGQFIATKIAKGRKGSGTHRIGGEVRSIVETGNDSASQYRGRAEFGEPVRPLTSRDWRQIQRELGPLPSNHDLRESRDRLACEMGIGTGMRVDEIASLTEFQLHGIYKAWQAADEERQQNGFFALRIIKTKRLKVRDVLVPGYLIPELMEYLDKEREVSIKVGHLYAKKTGQKYKRPTTLFVNYPQPLQHAGKPVKATSLSWAFKNACLNANITHAVEKIDIETEERYYEHLSKHRFHDLRHTFAVWTYQYKVANGDAEPWKEIQILLGHANLETTLQTYLAVTNVEQRNAGRAQYAAKRKLGSQDA